MDAIILAGGFGTRLKEMVPDLPKPLAPINGTAFLDLLIDFIEQSGVVNKIILAVGYKSEAIVEHYRKGRKIPIEFSIEERPLGTGGAVMKAMKKTTSSPTFVFNGDSLFRCSLADMVEAYRAPVTMAYTFVKDASRYGTVRVDQGNIVSFEEKKAMEIPGFVNAGIYLFDRKVFEKPLPEIFSLEKELFPEERIQGYFSDGLFIDIGTKESYLEAQTILGNE